MMDSVANSDEMNKVRTKMSTTVTKRVTGMFKGFLNKASKKVKSSMYRKNTRDAKSHHRSSKTPYSEDKIHLGDDLEDIRSGSVYR